MTGVTLLTDMTWVRIPALRDKVVGKIVASDINCAICWANNPARISARNGEKSHCCSSSLSILPTSEPKESKYWSRQLHLPTKAFNEELKFQICQKKILAMTGFSFPLLWRHCENETIFRKYLAALFSANLDKAEELLAVDVASAL